MLDFARMNPSPAWATDGDGARVQGRGNEGINTQAECSAIGPENEQQLNDIGWYSLCASGGSPAVMLPLMPMEEMSLVVVWVGGGSAGLGGSSAVGPETRVPEMGGGPEKETPTSWALATFFWLGPDVYLTDNPDK